MTTPRQVRFRNLLAYGSNDFLGAGAMAVISGWILFFYTTFCGLTALQATGIFAIARIIDAIVSPLIGFASDHLYRTRVGQRFGRRRFFLLASLPLLPSFALMWIDGHGYFYYLVTYVFFECVYAWVMIPYETLAAEMTPDYKTKAKFASARILCGQVAAFLAGILPGRIIEAFGKDSAETFFYMGIIFAAIFMFVVAMVYLFSWERTREEVDRYSPPTPHASALDALRTLYSDLISTFRVRAFRLHLGMYLGGYISQDVFNAVFTYFIIFVLGSSVVVASNMLGAMALAQFAAVGVFIVLIMRLQPAPSYRLAAWLFASSIVGFFVLYQLQPANLIAWLFVPVIFAGVGRGGLNYIPWNVYNYMADVDEIVTGRRREGAYAGVMTFARKAMQAAAVMTVGAVLEARGLVPGATTQSPPVISTIVTIMIVVTLIILAFGLWVSMRFKLDRDSHAVLMNEIEHFKAGGNTPTSAEAREIVENLSGFAYADLWGKNSVGARQAVGSQAPSQS